MKLQSLVNFENLNKIYQADHGKFHALKNINLKINKGELIAVVGASGSGKSTLMNILGFLDRPTSGKYIFLENEVSKLKDEKLSEIRNKKIGFVFQSFFLLPRLSALQNVMLPIQYRDKISKNAKQQALSMLQKVGINHLASNKPEQLSGGQQQRVAIARSLINDPEVILADEPTGALDSKTSSDVMDLFLKLNKEEKRTIIIVTHDKEVSRLCNRIITLEDGAIVEN